MVSTKQKPKSTQDILNKYSGSSRDKLIPVLQEIQDFEGFLSKESIKKISTIMKIPTAKIYGVATFYNQFRFQPLGKYHIMLCRGTACHVKGSKAILEKIVTELKINPGETTKDGIFSLEVVACIGACGLAPVISVNGHYHAKLTTDSIKGILNQYRKEAESV